MSGGLIHDSLFEFYLIASSGFVQDYEAVSLFFMIIFDSLGLQIEIACLMDFHLKTDSFSLPILNLFFHP